MSSAEIPKFTTLPPTEFDVPGTDIHARLFEDSDHENLARLADEPAVQQYVPWAKRIHDASSANDAISEFQSDWNRGVMARYAVENNSDFVGYCGIWSDKVPGYYEFGFATLPESRGQGIGTKVVTELLDIAKSSMDAEGMVAYVDDTNEASRAVISKLGFEPTDEIDDGDRRYELSFRK